MGRLRIGVGLAGGGVVLVWYLFGGGCGGVWVLVERGCIEQEGKVV